VLVGDGELNEGSNWESILIAAHHNLCELSVVVDCNESSERALKMGNLSNKFESFGWTVDEVDGHSIPDLQDYFMRDIAYFQSPNVLLAKTIKGKGIRRFENSPEWHHKMPSQRELEEMILELQ
jgi:transketolase